jgi:glycosyltransferase involved in cell wall biosynthesis
VGQQQDVRPWLWSADAFALLSSYEVFALAPLQAAAAGLPLLVTSTPGVASYVEHERSGLRVAPEPTAVAEALQRLLDLSVKDRQRMGAAAREAVGAFSVAAFVDRWRNLYRAVLLRQP